MHVPVSTKDKCNLLLNSAYPNTISFVVLDTLKKAPLVVFAFQPLSFFTNAHMNGIPFAYCNSGLHSAFLFIQTGDHSDNSHGQTDDDYPNYSSSYNPVCIFLFC